MFTLIHRYLCVCIARTSKGNTTSLPTALKKKFVGMHNSLKVKINSDHNSPSLSRKSDFPSPFSTPFFLLTVCRARLDLAFLIDGSGSIENSGKGNFRRCLHFVKRIIASFAVSRSNTRVGVALFSTRTWLIFGFNRYANRRQVYRAIDGIRYPSGGTRIGKALRFMYRRLFRTSRRRKVTFIKKKTLLINRAICE